MRVLVTGGAGYIGSHTVLQLIAAGHQVLIADDFSNAKPSVLPRLEELAGQPIKHHRIDLTDEAATEALFAAEPIDAVIHFAGFKAVGESVAKPLSYYRNNLDTTFSVLRAMDLYGVRRFVFSSSATVYGENPVLERTEDMPTSATNPYGWTKVMIEQVLRDLAVADDTWRIALLRYFNPVGAHVSGRIGEDPSGLPNNLMPFVSQVAVGRRDKLAVFGDDYDTVDGTGVRDYIHVEDLASGHLAALEQISTADQPLSVWNLGSGEPVSVLQVVQAFARASGREIAYEVVPRRPGDLAAYWADPSKANRELGWRATRTIDDMCTDTWRWQSQNPAGYPDA
ncbi:UDP-glucose 4-epimerase GalE [Gordonia sp. (in: high G+C Gram-positive bacteria)]|uniref:UDP-glucose 4-epimerase GalE n=1 Tax=Gordonia sp. (in: high G+C Gram-positive bacteria) TaxID=84139 RepID=UPI0016B93706|nr:UDP-glucose 4-epimerase GalE [Gordonia sp. (in: high G+C Gram-positive bacteria)]NLG46542.1 UDP-glucose 4-epimerase GalE [Gordonia sp. (in: high G+C Gram-positive bacteria)]